MAIMSMKFINIVGSVEKFNKIVMNYLIDNDIHLENVFNVLESIAGLEAFDDDNPYQEPVKRAGDLNEYFKQELIKLKREKIKEIKDEDLDEKLKYISGLEETIYDYKNKINDFENRLNNCIQLKKQVLHITDINIEIEKLFNLGFIKFRFGKLSKENYKRLNLYVHDVDVIVLPVQEEDEHVWISYFMPNVLAEKIDRIFSSLYFERLRISDEITGYPKDALGKMNNNIEYYKQQIKNLKNQLDDFIVREKDKFREVFTSLMYPYKAYDIRKYTAHTKKTFYITGWLPGKKLNVLLEELDKEKGVSCIVEEPEMVKHSKPPTILKNNRFFKPFESIVKMYGLPSHDEIDPTPFVVISYILMFGVMFGDLGQGFVLSVIGWIMHKKKKSSLGFIIFVVGISSMFFGLMYGSVFGHEELISPLLISPIHNIFLMLYVSVGFGVLMLIIAMVLNIVNGIKAKELGRILFNRNGVAGFIFYISAIGLILYFIINKEFIFSIIIGIVCFIIPLILIMFKDPLVNLIEKKKQIMPEDKGGFFVEGFFELLETLLGFISNTLSFIRIGAFALNHAGLSMAVWSLYNMAGNDIAKAGILIIGNMIIIALEGMIVGIQCLRLQYYEMFSRFFKGEGREFMPLSINENKDIASKA